MRGVKDEHWHQAKVFEWASLKSGGQPLLNLLYAVPNGGHRDIRVARKLQAEGVKRGVPDVVLPVPRSKWHGLYLELKRPGEPGRPKGRVSKEQRWWMDQLKQQGYYVVCRYGWIEAVETIEQYLSLGPFQVGDIEAAPGGTRAS